MLVPSSFVAPALALASLFVLTAAAACSGESTSDEHAGAQGPGGEAGADSGSSGAGGASAGEAGRAGGSPEGGASAGGVSAQGGAAGEGDEPPLGGAGASGAPSCSVDLAQHELAAGVHVETCSDISYETNPPSSGPHYPTWADFGVYDFPLPRGFWVHNLEHGTVVVTYNCASGCADEVAAAAAWLSELEADAACPAGPPRVILVPDPLLDTRWGASSWGFTLRAECFDAAAFTAFYEAHAGQAPAPEALVCSTGTNLRIPGQDTCGAS
jgi:hypothetical protein